MTNSPGYLVPMLNYIASAIRQHGNFGARTTSKTRLVLRSEPLSCQSMMA